VKKDQLRLLLSWSSSRSLLISSAIASIFWSALVICSALLLAQVIISVIDSDGNTGPLLLLLAITWSIRATFNPMFEYWCSKQASKIKLEIRNGLTSSVSEIKESSTSYLSALLIKGLNSLDIYLGRFIPQLFTAVAMPVMVITTIFILDPLSALIAILTLPLIPIFGALIGRYTADSVEKKWRSLGTLSGYFEDSLRGFVTLKIFGRKKSQSQRIESMGDKYTQETMKVLRISFLSAFALELVATISVAVIAVSIGLRLVDSHISFYRALAVLILAPEVYFPLRNAASLFHASADGTEALKQLVSAQGRIEKRIHQVSLDFSQIEKIRWAQWKLSIPGRIDSVIDSHTINSGEIHFLVGDSGIGKSSFALGLLGLRSDLMMYAGNTEQLISPDYVQAWQRSIGWVPQNPQLATGSVRSQFTRMNSRVSDEEITLHLGLSGLNISDLDKGLDTQIGSSGEAGHAISGGQLRKIALARAISSKPKFLIADEPTADMDDASSTVIMETLRQYAKNGTMVLCITHDLSLIEKGDAMISCLRGATR
jgi:ABC-type transport system involved in cytochrome bd biosynthesis fused ATPase/permease subunit